MLHSHYGPQILGIFGFFTFGLVTSLHCVGMCGPISTILFAPGSRKILKIRLAYYHIARLVGYSLIGVLLGSVGRSLNLSFANTVFGWLAILLLTLYALGVDLPKPNFTTKLQYHLLKRVSHKQYDTRAVLLGLFSPMLPCGLLYAAFAACLAAPSAMVGGTWMAAFAIGTIPLLCLSQWGIHLLRHRLKASRQRVLLRVIAFTGAVFIGYMQAMHT